MPVLPRAWGELPGEARIRRVPEDFRVSEELGFEPEGEGEHAFLLLEKRLLNTIDVQQLLSRYSGVSLSDVGYSGLKDRNAVTRQWFSVALAGREEPDWSALAGSQPGLTLVRHTRHRRKLRRGVHRANRFRLVLRQVDGDPQALESRLQRLRSGGAPNYFGPQRFGRAGATLKQAYRWLSDGQSPRRRLRGLYLSALRADLFNRLLAAQVEAGEWNRVSAGSVCMLAGSRSHFVCRDVDETLRARLTAGDIHPGLPLWGRDKEGVTCDPFGSDAQFERGVCAFLEHNGMVLEWRAARLVPDDFSWQFCDDDHLQLDFVLGAGSYATALLAELVHYKEGT
ncbi:MAG: tRNA pseudouridine(13) synthase TruD [Pseudomonadota bacterium]